MTPARRLADRTGHAATPAAVAAIDRRLADAIVEARARWPEVAVDPDELVDALVPRLEGEPDLDTALARLALPDVGLVATCLRGDRAGQAAFERVVRDETGRAVARLGPGAPAAEDVVQELLVKLLVPAEGRPAKLGAFAGHGALHAWIKVAAIRTAISMNRRKREVAVEDDALAGVADEADDQALAFLKSSYRAEFKRAFADALAALPKRARTVLRLQIIDQLTIEEIGAFYQASRATAARWLADARSQLVAGTHARLAASLGIGADELGELMRLVASSLYSTLPHLLRHTAG